jgi:peptidoglycan hydrolase-like amidase
MMVRVPPACAGVAVALFAVLPLADLALAQDADEREALRLEENWIRSLGENGLSHASGARPELGPVVLANPTQVAVTLRVGLYYSFTPTGTFSEFATLHHPFVKVSSTVGTVDVIDLGSGRSAAVMEPGVVYDVRHDGAGFVVSQDGGPTVGTFVGPVRFQPRQADEQLRVDSILRTNILASGTIVPRYRGALEVARGPATQAGRVNLVNLVEVESYVPGVVANESIASFHMEALKAQATAARGYAIANLGRFVASGFPFDIVDSSSSQVYRGIVSEHPNAVQASVQTLGLACSYGGRIISALYSSSMGGFTENNEWIFPSPSNQLPGANAEPYLRGVYDGSGPPPDLPDPEVLAAFWKTQQPQTFDSCAQVTNRFSRWRIVIPAAAIKTRLPGRYVLVSGDPATVLDGAITDVALPLRMAASQRAAVARITLTTGVVEVRGWDNLRNVLGRSVASTPLDCGTALAANFTLNNPSIVEPSFDPEGAVVDVTAYGGGWGHNVGMSQFGANGRGRAGQTFLEILNAYYTGADVGSYPIDLRLAPGTGPSVLRQSFMAPLGRGLLEVRNAHGLRRLIVTVNDTAEIRLSGDELSAPLVRVDLTPHLTTGLNVVQYKPVGHLGSATVTVIVD